MYGEPVFEMTQFRLDDRACVCNLCRRNSPPRVKNKQGKKRKYDPSGQEELVEEALRKIACDQLNGVLLYGTARVQFTMYELRQELKAREPSMHLDRLIRSLIVCRHASMIIRKQEENPKQAYRYAQFNPLVTHSIYVSSALG